jgi:hypothetical protein
MIDLAERTRAAEIGDLLQSLDLPATRLSEGQLATVAVAVASRPFLFEDLVIDDVERRWWMLLHRAANYEISVQSWERDQSSDWHDHGGSSGVLAVTSGVLLERYRDTDGACPRRRLRGGPAGRQHPRLLAAAEWAHALRANALRIRGS